MMAVDFIGILITAVIVGVRYPHYVLAATIWQQVGQSVMALFLHGKIESVLSAGAFSVMKVSQLNSYSSMLVLFSGAIANYILASAVGGVNQEASSALLNPFSRLKFPFAVINLRLALLTLVVNLLHSV